MSVITGKHHLAHSIILAGLDLPFFRFSLLCASLVVSYPTSAKQGKVSTRHEDAVITVTSPVLSPLTTITSPKTPRQPVPASDGSDYLKTVAGFSQIRNGGTNGDPVLRGMSGSRLRLLTNGGEILGACSSRMDAPSAYISPENFDLLTIVKGPQTVLWGPGNSAGTLRFERTHPLFDQPGIKGDASVLATSQHRQDVNADISVGNNNGYLRLTGNKSHADDYKDGNGKRVPSRWDKWNGDIAIGWTPDPQTLLELNTGQGDGSARYAGRGMDGAQFKRNTAGLRFEKSSLGEIFDTLSLQLYYNSADHIMDNHSLRTLTSSTTGSHSRMKAKKEAEKQSAMTSRVDRRTLGGRVMGSWIWSDFKLQSGMDLQTNTHHKKGTATGWSKDARFYQQGIFAELAWSQDEHNQWVGGTRLDYASADKYTDKKKRAELLSAGFMRLEHTVPDMPLMVYAGLGYTERFPDYWELFKDRYKNDVPGSNFTRLKKEKTLQLDSGMQYTGKRLNSWISGYIGQINDYILFSYSPDSTRIYQVDNISATIVGGEAGASYQLTDTLAGEASLSYSWGKNRSEHQPLPQMPPPEVRLGLSWQHGPWTSSAQMRMVSRQGRIALNRGNAAGKDFQPSPGFSIISANIAYQVNHLVKLSSGVDNIFNHAYSEHLNRAGNEAFGYSSNTPINETGRTWWAKVNLKF